MERENLNEKQAADYLGVSVQFMRNSRWRRGKDTPPFVKVGSRILYRKNDLAKFMEARLQGATPIAGE